jgi:hypothetical protein
MDQDDLPPEAHETSDDSGFWGSLGSGFTGVVGIALFLAIAGAGAYFLIHWLR